MSHILPSLTSRINSQSTREKFRGGAWRGRRIFLKAKIELCARCLDDARFAVDLSNAVIMISCSQFTRNYCLKLLGSLALQHMWGWTVIYIWLNYCLLILLKDGSSVQVWRHQWRHRWRKPCRALLSLVETNPDVIVRCCDVITCLFTASITSLFLSYQVKFNNIAQ